MQADERRTVGRCNAFLASKRHSAPDSRNGKPEGLLTPCAGRPWNKSAVFSSDCGAASICLDWENSSAAISGLIESISEFFTEFVENGRYTRF